jgi:hypothetical protein
MEPIISTGTTIVPVKKNISRRLESLKAWEEFDVIKTIPDLTQKQARFVQEYFSNGFNATAAYMSCFQYNSKNGAARQGSLLLKKAPVEQAIELLQSHLNKTEQIKRGEIVQVLKQTMYDCKSTGDKFNLLKTVDLLCKMGGLYTADNKPAVSINNEINLKFGGGFDPDKDPNGTFNPSGTIDVDSEDIPPGTIDDSELTNDETPNGTE